MIFKNAGRIVPYTIFILLICVGCKSNLDKLAIATCKSVETNVTKCSQLIADDISDKNANTLSDINEGDL